MNIYVGNIAYSLSEADMKQAFEAYGAVDSARIISDHDGRSKGFGFIEMPNADEATKAIEEMNGKELNERRLTVNEARPRQDRNSGGGGGGFRGGNGGGGGGRRY
ncbi:MAG: RNA-binding protein [Candidatus Zophobacter franzmannii]|jgi:RNA recognition motif-containing protein|nr:RNA-binding protein [Candidatus Zophobacter franzmannii]